MLFSKFMENVSSQLHLLQGGFRKGLGSSHASFTLPRAINHCRETCQEYFVALLDVRKAFDTVWHSGLFVKLSTVVSLVGYGAHYTTGILISHLQDLLGWLFLMCILCYSRGTTGCPFSPLFYLIYINDLLIELEDSHVEISVGDIYCSSPTYTDEMSLAANSQNSLQILLGIAGDYTKDYKVPHYGLW